MIGKKEKGSYYVLSSGRAPRSGRYRAALPAGVAVGLLSRQTYTDYPSRSDATI